MVDFKRKQIDLPAEITKAGERRIVTCRRTWSNGSWLAARDRALSSPSTFAESDGHFARK